MKKKQFFADFIIEGKKFSMELEVTKSGHRSWEITRDGFFIGSMGADRVISRDNFIASIGEFFSECLKKELWIDWHFYTISPIDYHRDYMYTKELSDGCIQWESQKTKMAFPEFISPVFSYTFNKVNALGILITWLKDNNDEIKQKLTIFNAAKKYGI
jgi:hypothetical protein